ncbi:hypothetical protein Desgi_4241 [Desulfoscipio gibsoniae DSM 7213]|uniref:Uncharacterized protein n=1 Tax=Desulfoscipio gibsoniae DSM 7213 TaxID=767817 RepID=R4KV49_9FIRM|nr:hypothetical protein Desgi_4241 [Desulfoscipio gibsoniae DSM 7213]
MTSTRQSKVLINHRLHRLTQINTGEIFSIRRGRGTVVPGGAGMWKEYFFASGRVMETAAMVSIAVVRTCGLIFMYRPDFYIIIYFLLLAFSRVFVPEKIAQYR